MRKVRCVVFLRNRIKMIFVKILVKRLCRFYKSTRRHCYGCMQSEKDVDEEQLCRMFRHEMVSNRKPNIPKRWDSLFDNEAGSDVEFLVGIEPDTWRFPGHRSILRKNPVFQAMLEGPWSGVERTIVIRDIDGRAFDHLLRHIYCEEVEIQSVGTALATIYAANKYLCPDLVKACVKYLDDHINTETVLHIYQHLRLFSSDLNIVSESDLLGFPSAPPQEEVGQVQCIDEEVDQCGKIMSQHCTSLLYNCYHYIDTNAEVVLNEESIEDLTRDALYDIAKRDTLGICSEILLFSVLERWCNRECKRCKLELTDNNRKSILGDRLIFTVRYLLMNSEEFLSGPMRSGLLEQSETTVLLAHILRHRSSGVVSHRLTPQILNFLKKPRLVQSYSPIPLSARSKHIVTSDMKSAMASKRDSKKEKEKKKKNRKNDDEGESKCFNYTLNVLASIFD